MPEHTSSLHVHTVKTEILIQRRTGETCRSRQRAVRQPPMPEVIRCPPNTRPRTPPTPPTPSTSASTFKFVSKRSETETLATRVLVAAAATFYTLCAHKHDTHTHKHTHGFDIRNKMCAQRRRTPRVIDLVVCAVCCVHLRLHQTTHAAQRRQGPMRVYCAGCF